LGFHAYSLRIDNLTNQWLLEETSLAWIPPYSLGMCLRLYGTGVAIILNQAPVGQLQLPAVSGEQTIGVYSDQLRTEVAGTGVRQFTLVQAVSDLTMGPEPALPPVGVDRLWADTSGLIHHLHSNGVDTILVDPLQTGVVTSGMILDGTIQGADLAVPVNVPGTIRSTAETDPTSGVGLELFWQTVTPRGVVQAFDRSGNAYADLILLGRNLQLAPNAGGVGGNLILPNQSITTPMLANNAATQPLADTVLPGAFTTTSTGSWVPALTTASVGCQGGRQRIEFNGLFLHTAAGANFYTGFGVDGVVGQALSYTTLGPAGTYTALSWVFYTSQPVGNHTFSVFVNNSNAGTLTMSNIINSYLHVTEEKR
jgi:hypothetical protein